MMVGRLLSFWDGLFSGAMLNFRGVSKCLARLRQVFNWWGWLHLSNPMESTQMRVKVLKDLIQNPSQINMEPENHVFQHKT